MKSYGSQNVFDHFSCEFSDAGFYLLFGESGCGKTTLINILAGLTEIDGGEICMTPGMKMEECSSYITQDPFFVDFLDVMDNMKLVCGEEEHIRSLLRQYGLDGKENRFPETLSGGERQRLAFARAMAGGKKVLFLDEPTAACDKENSRIIFETLAGMRDQVLIICASHDAGAIQYADHVIRFSKDHGYGKAPTGLTKTVLERVEKRKEIRGKEGRREFHRKVRSVSERKQRSLPEKSSKYGWRNVREIIPYMKKYFRSSYRDRKSMALFCIFLTIAMCLCALADTPDNKLNSNIEYVYKVNMCRLTTYGMQEGEYEALWEVDGMEEVVLDYGLSVPTSVETTSDDGTEESEETGEEKEANGEFQEMGSVSWEVNVPVLPFSAEAFRLSDQLQCGTWFTEANQIILSAEMAETMAGDTPEKLLGQTLTKEFYGVGSVEFEIVGIFEEFDDIEKMYMKAMGVNIQTGEKYSSEKYADLWFINGKFMEQYADNSDFHAAESQRSYVLYFDSYKSMKDWYDQNRDAFSEQGDSLLTGFETISYRTVFDAMYRVILPLSFAILFFTVLFYLNLQRVELVYNSRFLSAFDYLGFPPKKVMQCFIWLNAAELIRAFLGCAAAAALVMCVVNLVNRYCLFVVFQIFTWNWKLLSGFGAFFLLISLAVNQMFFRKFGKVSWYENMVRHRDLL
ncbi:MAG: ATP-binding cassette domain-containing protein [Lachnospiraceae bacterium]|nr:ATP-binding cassette domain-containing protein [Lachnospiraceae bacterium]